MAISSDQLEFQVRKVWSNILLDSWTTTDTVLHESVENFVNSNAFNKHSALPDQHVAYLAERIYLDNLNSEQVNAGIEHYLRHVVNERFGDDNAREKQLGLICRDAKENTANTASAELAKFLDASTATPPVGTTSTVSRAKLESLDFLKNTSELMRYGDVVFLPSQCDIIVIGDTHGDLASTQKMIEKIKSTRHLERGGYVVFLGDYVNNGVKSWQNVLEILKLQASHPHLVVVLNGNHEFKESYLTAINEFFYTHWNRFTVDKLPANLQDRIPEVGNHYGHLRLQLIRDFGFEEGEHLYEAYASWGTQLPLACISGNVMISHSLGKQDGVELSLIDLLNGKQHDAEHLQHLGFETWQACRPSLHSDLVNTRIITTELLNDFSRILEVDHFVVGHCHYRSGDTIQLGNNKISTVVSSNPYSPDAGHYMYEQMAVARHKMRPEENLPKGNGAAGYLQFTRLKDRLRKAQFVDG